MKQMRIKETKVTRGQALDAMGCHHTVVSGAYAFKLSERSKVVYDKDYMVPTVMPNDSAWDKFMSMMSFDVLEHQDTWDSILSDLESVYLNWYGSGERMEDVAIGLLQDIKRLVERSEELRREEAVEDKGATR